jgi:hypothetical protein
LAFVEPLQIAVIRFLCGAGTQAGELITGAVFFNQFAQGAMSNVKGRLAFKALGIFCLKLCPGLIERVAAKHSHATAVFNKINVQAFFTARCVGIMFGQITVHFVPLLLRHNR